MEDGWARVSERVVEVVTEEVFFLVLFRFPNQFVAVQWIGELIISAFYVSFLNKLQNR